MFFVVRRMIVPIKSYTKIVPSNLFILIISGIFMPSSRFDGLREAASKAQDQVYDQKTGKYVKGNKTLAKSDAVIAEECAKYFLSNGLAFKGLAQCAYVTQGGGLGISASFDPGRICFGVLSTEVEVSAAVTGSSLVVLVALRGPASIGLLTIPRPITINCLTGRRWTGSVSASAFVGVSVGASINTEDGASTERSWDEPGDPEEEAEDEDPGLKMELESIGCKVEVKAGAQAEASYTYEHLYAEDVCPISFSDPTVARQTVAEILQNGSYKATQKINACKFANSSVGFFKEVQYEGLLWGHTSSSDISTILTNGCKKPGIPLRYKTQAEAIIADLSCWADKDQPPPRIATSVRICCHKGDGKAGLLASAEASASAVAVSVKAEAKAEALTISGSYKSAGMRYQSVFPVDGDKSYIVMTQDSKVVYKQVKFVGLSITGGVSASVLGNEIAGKEIGGEDEEIEYGAAELINSMTYTASCVFWHISPNTDTNPKTKANKNMMFPVQHLNPSAHKALPGSGISFGGSFEIVNLRQFYYTETPKSFEAYFAVVAASLNVSTQDLTAFFTDLQYSLLSDIEDGGVQSVLLEASFVIDAPAINLIVTKREKETKYFGKNTPAMELIELSTETAADFIALPNAQRTLQAIRLRYRMQDKRNNDKDFTLGNFKVAGNSVGITLKRVDQAGSEGIVDLYTKWFTPGINAHFDPTIPYNDEKSVPPVTLFCQ